MSSCALEETLKPPQINEHGRRKRRACPNYRPERAHQLNLLYLALVCGVELQLELQERAPNDKINLSMIVELVRM